MALSYSGNQAFEITRANPMRAWHGDPERSAGARFSTGQFIDLNHVPKFGLELSEPVFTVGSCFARSVENVLARMGVPLVTDGYGLETRCLASWSDVDKDPRDPKGITRGVLNKYSVHSMTHDLRRSLKSEEYENEGLIEVSEGKWFDPHSSGLKLFPLEAAIENRRQLECAMTQVRKAKVIFITLGLTESWIDTQTGLVMNSHPGPQFFKKFGERFRFINYSYQEILSELRELVSLVRAECSPLMKFIITVSPIPFGATFRPQDVIVANSASKATLRAVTDQLQLEDDLIDYFPSYEIVMNSPREMAWEIDHLHVRGAAVEHIMALFKKSYYQI